MTNDGAKEESLNGGNENNDDVAGDVEPTLMGALETFSSQQRFLAGIDFSAFTAPRIPPTLFDVPALRALQESVAMSVAQSINFPALQQVFQSIALPHVADIAGLQTKWAADFTKAIDFSAIARANELVLSSTALWEATGLQRELLASLSKQLEITNQFDTLFRNFDWQSLKEGLSRWLPDNLHDADDLDEIARICLDEGIPLAWVPRPVIVSELASASSAKERQEILEGRSSNILDDCELALAQIHHEWARQVRSAIAALRQDGLEGPAQSHAAGIIDSIVVTILGGLKGRNVAKAKAVEPFEDVPIRVAAENLVLRPLFLGFAEWYPNQGSPIPTTFARHVVAHGVGQPDVRILRVFVHSFSLNPYTRSRVFVHRRGD